MSADLHIHVLTGDITEDDLAVFFANTIGSKWFSWTATDGDTKRDVYKLLANTPDIWIGEVSWLKAALFEDNETYVPGTVSAISDMIGEELPVLTPELRDRILTAFALPNKTAKQDGVWNGQGYELADPQAVRVWLDAHLGERLFTVSW